MEERIKNLEEKMEKLKQIEETLEKHEANLKELSTIDMKELMRKVSEELNCAIKEAFSGGRRV